MLNQKDKKKVCDIADYICRELLDIQPVPIKFERNEGFSTQTTKAILCIKDNGEKTIYIDPEREFNPEIVFDIGHELRHLYQFQILGMNGVLEKPSSKCTVEEYNMQFPELDANAFGEICMVEITGCKPLYNGFSKEVKDAINERVEFLFEHEFIREFL